MTELSGSTSSTLEIGTLASGKSSKWTFARKYHRGISCIPTASSLHPSITSAPELICYDLCPDLFSFRLPLASSSSFSAVILLFSFYYYYYSTTATPMSRVPTKFHCPSALSVVAGKSTLRKNFFPLIQMDRALRLKTFSSLPAVFVKLHEQVKRRSN